MKLWCAVGSLGLYLTMVNHGYSQQRDNTQVKALIGQFSKELENGAIINQLVSLGATEALPIFKERYAALAASHGSPILESSWLLKGQLASAIVKLGDKDKQYWNYLETEGKIVA